MTRRDRDGLARRWAGATLLGEAAGFAVPGAAGAVAFALDAPDAVLVLVLVAAGAAEGAVLGFAQSRVLPGALPALQPRDWVRATAIAAALAWAGGMTVGSQWERLEDVASWLPVVAMAVVGTGIVLSIGTAQWLVLRRHLANAAWWIPANAVAWLLGVSLVIGGMSVMTEDTPAVVMGLVAGACGVGMAATVAVVTGIALARLLEAEEESRLRHECRSFSTSRP